MTLSLVRSQAGYVLSADAAIREMQGLTLFTRCCDDMGVFTYTLDVCQERQSQLHLCQFLAPIEEF
jgi:hypothetical protein